MEQNEQVKITLIPTAVVCLTVASCSDMSPRQQHNTATGATRGERIGCQSGRALEVAAIGGALGGAVGASAR